MLESIISKLPFDFPWKDRIHYFKTIDSTNTRAKALAAQGVPHGTVLIAGQQTAGRGRLGRSFQSPDGMGVYLSVILRPHCPPEQLMHLTCAAAVAMCDAVETTVGFRPGIKWTNDLVAGKKKLGGILTELSVSPKNGFVEYAVIGIGINCNQKVPDFPPELQNMATSLSEIEKKHMDTAAVAAAMVRSLSRMDSTLLTQKAAIMQTYRSDCITLGQDVVVLRQEETRYGKALDLDDDGGLIVAFRDGSVSTVTSGEVSVRGMYGYV